MNTPPSRATYGLIFALAMLSLAQPSFAQQKAATSPQQAPASSQPTVTPAPAAPSATVQSAPAVAATDAAATSADGRSLKSTAVALRELSPWSMFLSADVLVK